MEHSFAEAIPILRHESQYTWLESQLIEKAYTVVASIFGNWCQNNYGKDIEVTVRFEHPRISVFDYVYKGDLYGTSGTFEQEFNIRKITDLLGMILTEDVSGTFEINFSLNPYNGLYYVSFSIQDEVNNYVVTL